MKLLIFVGTFLIAFTLLPASAKDYGAPGPDAILIEDGVLEDEARAGRQVPYLLYRPSKLEGIYPVLVFSHGLCGSRAAGAYLGKHLASHGYLSLHLQHPGSDESVWQDARTRFGAAMRLRWSMLKPQNAIHRYRDIPFVVDRLADWNRSGPLAGHIRLDSVGMYGHSYGARSTLIAAGEAAGSKGLAFKNPRIRAAVALSPNLPRRGADASDLYDAVDIPVFHITGTRDDDPLSRNFDPEQRSEPYKRISAPGQYLLVLDGADHRTFSGRRAQEGNTGPREARFHTAVKAGVLAFFDAYLRGDTTARAWLREDYASHLAPGDRFEFKD